MEHDANDVTWPAIAGPGPDDPGEVPGPSIRSPRRTCSILVIEADQNYGGVVVAHGADFRLDSVVGPWWTHADDARAWARRRAHENGLVVVHFRVGPVVRGDGWIRLSVLRSLQSLAKLRESRTAALSLEIRCDAAGHARGVFAGLHVEDPAGVACPILAPLRCDGRCERGHGSAIAADALYRRHGYAGGVSAESEMIYHAMAGLLYARSVDLSACDVRGATPAVAVLDETPVASVDELLAKYGPRGIGLLVNRCVDLLGDHLSASDPDAIDFVTRLATATADLESALADAERRRETRDGS
jgi:hypothetical protein